MRDRDLKARLTQFGIDIVVFARALPDDVYARDSKRQIIRSATSIGANYREAEFARTKTEFASKIQIAVQEANETQHWLETVIGTQPRFADRALRHLAESKELTAILASASKTAKSRPSYRGQRH